MLVITLTIFSKPKIPKDELNDFILRYNIKHRIVSKKIEQIKIADDCYFGENLEHKHNFLNNLEEKNQEKFEDSECSNFWQKNNEFMCGNESRNYRNKGKKVTRNCLLVS